MQLGERSKIQSAINVTPLVDVVLVLLIIFMVVAPAMRPGPEIDLPDTAKPPEQAADEDRILVTIDERGELWIEDEHVAADRFGEDLLAAAGGSRNAKVVIQGDSRLRFGDVRQTMVAIENAGFGGAGLIAERAHRDTRGG